VTFFSKKEAIWQFFCRHLGVVLCASSFKQDDKTSAAKQLTSTDRNPLFLIYTIVFSERGAKVDRYSSYTTGVRSKGQGSNPPDYGGVRNGLPGIAISVVLQSPCAAPKAPLFAQ
jgi:hypothetical protein